MIIIETNEKIFDFGHRIEDIKKNDIRIYKTIYTRKLHFEYANLSGDKSPIHTDNEFSKKNGFEDIIGYGFFLNTLLSKIYGMYFPGGTELCIRDTSNYRFHFYINDQLSTHIKVIGMNKNLKLLTLKKEIYNQNQVLIFDGETVFKLSLSK